MTSEPTAVAPVYACLSIAQPDPPAAHVKEWLEFHRGIGISHIFTNSAHAKGANVTVLPPSGWPWNGDTAVLYDADGEALLRSRFVGQVDFLSRCVSAASAMAQDNGAAGSSGSAWLANLDLDEYIMPANARVGKRSNPEHRLPLVLHTANRNHSIQCMALRRHNFFPPESEMGFSTLSAAEKANLTARAPLRRRTWRAPFPPWPMAAQPFLAKWVLHLPASSQLVVNNHEVWNADGCRNRCRAAAAAAATSAGGGGGTVDDPAGLGGLLPATTLPPQPNEGPRHPTTRHAAGTRAGLRLLASLLSPMATPCYLAAALVERCVGGGRVSGLAPVSMLPAQDVLPSATSASRSVQVAAKGRGSNNAARGGRIGSAPPPDYRLRRLAEASTPPDYRLRRRLAEAGTGTGTGAGGVQLASEASRSLRASLQRCLVTNPSNVANSSRGGASTPSPTRPLRFCWQEACMRGGAAESWVRIHHYGRPPTTEQKVLGHPGYKLERSGEPEEDTHALHFVNGLD